MKSFFVFSLSIVVLFVFGCDSKKHSKSTAKNSQEEHFHGKGAHNGTILDSGGTLHVELVHNKKKGKVALYILGRDGKTPQKITQAPLLNLKTADGPKQIQTTMVNKDASQYEATDDVLKKSLKGRIAIQFEKKRYNLDIQTSHDNHGHGHKHGDHGHKHDDHGHKHGDHGHDHPEHSISHTAWTKQCEWFVELETPEEGKPAGFAAHVTLLSDFSPATKGSFTAKATLDSEVISTTADKPARDGIYTPKITFSKAGKWTLQLTYKSGDISDRIEYQIEVYKPGKIPHEEEEETKAISFLKEQQWKIKSFATVWSKEGKVPASAIVKQGEKSFVYVQLDEESFEKREVKVSKQEGDWAEVAGIKDKERVVTKGANAITKK